MRRYEFVFVLAPNLAEEEVEQIVQTFSKTAEELGAKILQVEHWGKRRLAFPVKKHQEGIYVILLLEEERGVAVQELERRCKVSENVIRFLTVRIDEDLKRAEKLKAAREERRKRRDARRASQVAVAEE